MLSASGGVMRRASASSIQPCITGCYATPNAEQNREEQNTENRDFSPLDQASPKSTRATSEAR